MNIVQWMVDEKLASNNFAAAHIANGLKLAGCSEEEQKRRIEQYRLWRRASKDSPAKCYEYVLEGKEPPQELFMLCGHPESAVIQADEGTAFCGECTKESK